MYVCIVYDWLCRFASDLVCVCMHVNVSIISYQFHVQRLCIDCAWLTLLNVLIISYQFHEYIEAKYRLRHACIVCLFSTLQIIKRERKRDKWRRIKRDR